MDKLFAWGQGGGAKPDPFVCHRCDGEALGSYSIKIIEALSDNYSYLIVNSTSQEAVAVDVAEAPRVSAVVDSLGARLVAVLTTHCHGDHAGGNAELAASSSALEIVAGERDFDRTPCATRSVGDGEAFVLAGLAFTALHTPGHTVGHTSYLLDAKDGQAPAVFTGDCLFVGGCGRFMEGTPEVMQRSLAKLAALDPATRVFPGHEYTTGNLKFCCALEPDNGGLEDAYNGAVERRGKQLPTVPSTIFDELRLNPFLRVDDANVQRAVDCEGDALRTLAAVRRKKDTFTTVGKVITFFLDTKAAFSSPTK